MQLQLNNKFSSELPADSNETNVTRQVLNACFSYVNPRVPSNPKLLHVSEEVAELIGLSTEEIQSQDFLDVFSGKKILAHSKPYAMAYAGHQFGNWAGQLGDGRAIVLGEIEHNNQNWMLQLKGAGSTPYSRRADGLAVLRSSIREHLCSEAMFHLGVPTTRSLSLMLTGDEVLRDVMYNGNAEYEKGAVVCRVAPTFIRFGSFELFSAQNDIENLKKLADFTIKYYYPEIQSEGKEKYISFFKHVAVKTREMIVHWQRVGFVHGVMNTDNMSILGITIDYGPYGWLEDFNHEWTPNTTDREHRRYGFGNQPDIALWNLLQLANALYPLIEEASPLEAILNDFQLQYENDYSQMMHEKLGLSLQSKSDERIINELEKVLLASETDMTLFFRELGRIKKDHSPGCAIAIIDDAFYKPEEIKKEILKEWEKWFKTYLSRLNKESLSDEQRKEKMDAVNPKYVLRNYMAQMAIEAANNDDYSLIIELQELLKNPYQEQPLFEKWYAKRPDWAKEKIGCSMLSCSS
ncbi:YdiU family protein [Flavobacterium sp. SUN052]|uniref:protein adenylyltransferase SelO n=1 Tax=Flavobacterium sp. SUN052 TaxID=3002441 RepID=UPI00237E55B6|nr:YdiU family protein [Flavobacterium sp. SUN052]MEC4003706.1 YdiU family protein [Flavobacterium sp. SUN052]